MILVSQTETKMVQPQVSPHHKIILKYYNGYNIYLFYIMDIIGATLGGWGGGGGLGTRVGWRNFNVRRCMLQRA